jgi:hypothetical protein
VKSTDLPHFKRRDAVHLIAIRDAVALGEQLCSGGGEFHEGAGVVQHPPAAGDR